jgi:predicted lysophospholipase L1 biosynthesis ABC-type transport system permease subunit
VAIVSERLVRRHIPDRDPVGERLTLYGRSYTIVGVVGEVRHSGPRYEPDAEIYLPLAQSPSLTTSFVVRAAGDRTRVMTLIRQRIAEVDPQLPVEQLRTMEQVMHESLSQPRLSAQYWRASPSSGLVLALTGLYGVIAYPRSRGTREIAIRVSLGASATGVLRLVLWRGARLAAAGLIVGVPLALGLSQIMKSTLAATSPRDLIVLTIVPVLLIVAALAATYVPARRATRIQPIVALRGE